MSERWVDQTTFWDPEDDSKGNCTEACIASIFNIPLEEVRPFWDPEMPDSYRFYRNMENFCMSRGYWLHRIDREFVMEGIYIASGPAARGCSHMVVMRDGELLHDPHPSRAGLLEIQHTWLLIPVDPAQFTRKA
jgi:hypothetical protein